MASNTNNSQLKNTTIGMIDEEKKSNPIDDEIRCSQYHHELVPGFVDTTTQNITKRINQLLCIINQNDNLLRSNCKFSLDVDAFVMTAMSFIAPLVKQNTVVQVTSCKKVPKSKHQYKKVARNRLNRSKPKFVGNYIFEPIIFHQLPAFCSDHFSNNSMEVFISLFQDILSPHSVVRYEQTRAQPLIPYNTLVMDNKFRHSCTVLLRHYKLDIEWQNGNKNKSNKKKESAKEKFDCFNECLSKLADMVQCDKYKKIIPNNFSCMNNVQFTTRNPIIPADDNKMDDDVVMNQYEYKSASDNTFYDGQIIHNNCNQNQQICDCQMMNYQPQNYCNCQSMSHNTGYTIPIVPQIPAIPQFVPPNIPTNIPPNIPTNIPPNIPTNIPVNMPANIQSNMAANNYNNNSNINYNSFNFVPPQSNYMDCGCMDNTIINNITNANIECNYMLDNNDNDVQSNPTSNDMFNDTFNDTFGDSNNNNPNIMHDCYNENDFEFDEMCIMDHDFDMNSIFPNSAVHDCDYCEAQYKL